MAGAQGILITIQSTKGSTPRDVGAELWVSEDALIGSIGGGALEADAIHYARAMLRSGQAQAEKIVTLGPEMGQCCGGLVGLRFEAKIAPTPAPIALAIFGAGHVGAQLSKLARAADWQVALYDVRQEVAIENAEPYERLLNPTAKIREIAALTHVVIMTHDHGLDFRLAEAALLRDDLGFVGMIGSKSKAAQFRAQFSALGTRLERLHAPLAKHSNDKRPLNIALEILTAIYQSTARQGA